MRVPSSALEISGHGTTERWNRFERHWLLLLVAMVGGVDLESWADLVGLVPFLVLGVGLFAATRPKRERVVVGLGLCTLVAGSVLWTFLLADPASAVLPTNDVSAMNDASENRAVAPEMETIYWQRVKPESATIGSARAKNSGSNGRVPSTTIGAAVDGPRPSPNPSEPKPNRIQ